LANRPRHLYRIYLVAKLRAQRRARHACRFLVPIAIVALIVGPGELLFWAVSERSYLEAKNASMSSWRFLQKTGSYVAPHAVAAAVAVRVASRRETRPLLCSVGRHSRRHRVPLFGHYTCNSCRRSSCSHRCAGA